MLAPSIEQYAAAQRRVTVSAQIVFARWLLANPGFTRWEAADAARRIIDLFTPVAEHVADAWFDAIQADEADEADSVE